MKMRAPATPIVNIDPYFSVWCEDSVLKNAVHWTGSPNTMSGRLFVDGEQYHFLGFKAKSENVTDLTIESTKIDAYSTIITYRCDTVKLTVHFTSPLLVDDLYYASRPVAYCKASFESLDGKDHDVKVKFTASEELVLNLKGEGRALADKVDIKGATAIKMGNGNQNVLWRSGDNIRIDWGYMYLAVKGEGVVGHTVIDNMYAMYIEADLKNEALFAFAFDDVKSINYFGDKLDAYWKKDGKTIEEAITEAFGEYDELLSRCNAFSENLKEKAVLMGNEKYAEILMLSIRQVMAAHKLVVDKNGNNLYISKECNSNGCAATVDVTYPSAPIFLIYNVELLKGMLRPVMDYAATDEWYCDFAPHDVGRYPIVTGQVYGVDRKNEIAEINLKEQMPVEECGNMIILFSAICDAENDTSFVKPYLNTIEKWSKYLIEYGLDPENQLCTDDFAGHLAHNVNLSIKAVMGIVAYSRILSRLGEKEKAESLMNTAKEYAASIICRAENKDGSYRLAFDKPDTFSLKYNAVWDLIWGTNIFPEKFYENEIIRYKKEILPYGVPLDSREKYTKSDWLCWVASFCKENEDFTFFTDTLWSAYNTMRTRVAMTDWYYADTSHMKGFRHRTVQGGLFIRLMF